MHTIIHEKNTWPTEEDGGYILVGDPGHSTKNARRHERLHHFAKFQTPMKEVDEVYDVKP